MKKLSRRISPGLLLAAASLLTPAHALTVDTTSGDVTRTDSITDGTLLKTGTGTLTLAAASTLTGTVEVKDGTLVVDQAQALQGTTTLSVNAATSYTQYTLSGHTFVPTGAVAATQGVMTLNASPAGIGAVSVNGGAINGPGSLSAASIYIKSGTISANIVGATTLTVGDETIPYGILSMGGPQDVGGPTIISGTNSHTGGTFVRNGILDVRNATGLGHGDVTVSGTITTDGFTIPSAQLSTVTTTVPSGSGTLNSGTLELGGNNTYTGTITIPGNGTTPGNGVLTLSAAVSTPGNLILTGGTINGTGSLSASTFDVRSGHIQSILTGSGTLAKSGAGTVSLDAKNTYTGGTIVQNGALRLTAANAVMGNISVSGGTLDFAADQTLAKIDVASNGTFLASAGNSVLHAGVLSGNIFVNTGASLTLDGSAKISQPEGAHPNNVVFDPLSTTISTSTLSVDGSLSLIGNSHQLGVVTGAGDIYIEGGATYSAVATRFTGNWFFGKAPATDGTMSTPGTPPTPSTPDSSARPSSSGGLTMDGTIMLQGDTSSATGRLTEISGSGSATIITDWTGYDTIRVRDGITLNLGQGSYHSVEASLVQIDAGATLKGLGSITGSLVNNGTLAPGNSPGIITVGGDFTNNFTGTVNIEIAGTNPGTGYDVIRYAGQAVINGGTLNVTLLNGFKPAAATSFRFLEDTDTTNGAPSVVGTFTSVYTPSGLYSLLTADASGMSITLSPTLAGMPGASVPRSLLSTDIAAGSNASLQTALDSVYKNSGGAAAVAALKGFSPIGLGALTGLALDASNNDARAVAERADLHRASSNSKYGEWTAYAGYSGSFASAGSGTNATAYDHTLNGARAGLEHPLGDAVVLGVSPSYAFGRATFTDGAGQVNLDRAGLVAYAAVTGDSTTLQAGAKAAYDEFKTRRSHLFGTDTGITEGAEVGGFIAVSHKLKLGDFTITPEAGADYTYVDIGGYTESNPATTSRFYRLGSPGFPVTSGGTGTAAALRVRRTTQDSLRARVGTAFDWLPVNDAGDILAVGFDIGASHELLKHHTDIDANFAGGSTFTTPSALNARTTFQVGPHIAWTLGGKTTLRLGYVYEDGLGEQTAHRLDFTYSMRF